MAVFPDSRCAVRRFLFLSVRVRGREAFLAAVAVVALQGCDDGNLSGQVIAVVNGEEITVPELNAEARARGLVIGNDRGLRDKLIQDILERKLLVQEATDRKLDRTPEHLLAERRASEMLLAGELPRALGRQRSSPSESELAQLIKARPYAFDQRALFTVDRIAVPASLAPDLARSIATARSLDEAQALLGSRGIVSERRIESWDSATFAPKLAQQLIGRIQDDNVLLELPGQTVIASVIEVIPQATPAASRAQFARELLINERSQQDLQTMLLREKSSAIIRYNPRFAPGRNAPAGEN